VKKEFSLLSSKKLPFQVMQKYQEKEAKNIAQNERIPPET
jgi:hypothetical protein